MDGSPPRVASADGAVERALTGGGADYDDHPSWSPDGLFVAFQRGEAPPPFGDQWIPRWGPSADTGVFFTPSAGGGPEALVARGRHPAWRPRPVQAQVPGNRPPIAELDQATTRFRAPIELRPLGNDEDPDGDALELLGFEAPARGELECAEAVCTYTPGSRFVGRDAFAYQVGDGRGGRAEGRVEIEVTGLSPRVEIRAPSPGKEVLVPGPAYVTGTARLDSAPQPTNLLYLLDLHSGRRTHYFEFGSHSAGGLPAEWLEAPEGAAGPCVGFADDWGGDGVDLVECALTLSARAGLPAARAGLLSFADDYFYDAPVQHPERSPAVFRADVSPLEGAQDFTELGADADQNGRADLEEVLHSARYGGCNYPEFEGPEIEDDTGVALFGARAPVRCRVRDAYSRGQDSYDFVLERMNAAFAELDAARNVALLVSAGRGRVTEGGTDAPLERAVRMGTVINVLTQAARPTPPVDVVVVVQPGMDDKAERVRANLAALGAALAGSAIDWRVGLVGATDWFEGSPLEGDPRYRFVLDAEEMRPPPLDFFRASPLSRAMDHAAALGFVGGEAPLHLVVVADEALDLVPAGADVAGLFLEEAEALYERPLVYHSVGSPGRALDQFPQFEPCSAGARHEAATVGYAIARRSGGVRVDISGEDWRARSEPIVGSSRPLPSPCDLPNHPLARIAARTGGTCTALSWESEDFAIPIPPLPRLDGGAERIVSVEVRREGGAPVAADFDPESGLFSAAVPGIVVGPNALTARLRTQNGLEAEAGVVVQGVAPPAEAEPPLAREDLVQLDGAGVGAVDVLLNDEEPEGGELSVRDVLQPRRGSVACTPEGRCTYTAGPDFEAADTFEYLLQGPGGTAVGLVRVGADPNTPPVAPPIRLRGAFDEVLRFSLLEGAQDAEGPVSLVSHTAPRAGELRCELANGDCEYTPDPKEVLEHFSYTVEDLEGARATGPVTLEIGGAAPRLRPEGEQAPPFRVGVEAEYRLRAFNEGGSEAQRAELRAWLPAGLIPLSAEGAGWACGIEAGLVSCETEQAIVVAAGSPWIRVALMPAAEGELATIVEVSGRRALLRTPVLDGDAPDAAVDGPPADAGQDSDSGSDEPGADAGEVPDFGDEPGADAEPEADGGKDVEGADLPLDAATDALADAPLAQPDLRVDAAPDVRVDATAPPDATTDAAEAPDADGRGEADFAAHHQGDARELGDPDAQVDGPGLQDDGCGCRAGHGGSAPLLLCLLLLGIRRRRR